MVKSSRACSWQGSSSHKEIVVLIRMRLETNWGYKIMHFWASSYPVKFGTWPLLTKVKYINACHNRTTLPHSLTSLTISFSPYQVKLSPLREDFRRERGCGLLELKNVEDVHKKGMAWEKQQPASWLNYISTLHWTYMNMTQNMKTTKK